VTNILQVRKIIIHKIVPNVFFIVGYNIVWATLPLTHPSFPD
jgi:hypothetical protein